MNPNPHINETLLQMKYARIIGLLADRLNIDHSQALDIFYQSNTYQSLNNLENNFHNMSDAYIVDEILNEVNCVEHCAPRIVL